MKQLTYKTNKNLSKGFTLTELIVGLSIGIVVLTGLMSFYFRTSKTISQQQSTVKDLNQLQFIMNKIVDDIKEANTVPKEESSIVSAWGSIPYMGYGHTYPYNPTLNPPKTLLDSYNLTTTEPKEYPVYPVAYNFPIYQSGFSGTYQGWYPRQNPNTEIDDLPRECNSLVFYKIVNNQILRIIYYTDPINRLPEVPANHLTTYNLKRRVQYPPVSTSLVLKDETPASLDSTTSKETVVISNLKFVQFTYPLLAKKVSNDPNDPDYSSTEYDSELRTKLNSESNQAKQSVLMNPYRNIIKIRIAIAGPQIGDKKITSFELSTEVTVRN